MELHQLRAFVATAEELHVSRAALRLHLTQPTLSRQITALERAVGVPLFNRVRRRLTLTRAGEAFLTGAREIVRRADDLVRDAQRAHRGELGVLRIGFVQSATFRALPQLIGSFRQAYPDVVLETTAMTTLDQSAALHAGEIDAGLLRLPISEPGLATRVVSRDPLVVALPAAHRLTAMDRVPLAALADEPFILYRRMAGPTVQDAIVGHCMAAGFKPSIVQEAIDVQTIVALVAGNLGVSLLISPTPPTDEAAVVYRPLAEDLPPWELGLAWSRDNHSAVLGNLLDGATGLTSDAEATRS